MSAVDIASSWLRRAHGGGIREGDEQVKPLIIPASQLVAVRKSTSLRKVKKITVKDSMVVVELQYSIKQKRLHKRLEPFGTDWRAHARTFAAAQFVPIDNEPVFEMVRTYARQMIVNYIALADWLLKWLCLDRMGALKLVGMDAEFAAILKKLDPVEAIEVMTGGSA